MSAIKPRTKTPDMEVQIAGNGGWQLSNQTPENFTLVVVYRGLHCPICRPYMAELNRLADDFAKLGVEVIGVSTDGDERAQTAKEEWKLDRIRVGYDLSIESARSWGLNISTSRGKTSIGIEEPELFSEPGIFLVTPEQTLYASVVSTMPFARPHFKDILGAVQFIVDKGYPARGEA